MDTHNLFGVFISFFLFCGTVSTDQQPPVYLYDYICESNSSLFQQFFNCFIEQRTVGVKPSSCLSYDDNDEALYAGKCLYTVYGNSKPHHHNMLMLPEIVSNLSQFNEDIMCNSSNRMGTLCSYCSANGSILLNSIYWQCTSSSKCHSYHWIYFIMAHIAPVTALFLIITICNVRLTSGYAYGYLFFSQVLCIVTVQQTAQSGLAYFSQSAKWAYTPVLIFYSLFSLDFGRLIAPDLCVGQYVNGMDVIALQYLPPYFLLFLVLVYFGLKSIFDWKRAKVITRYKLFSSCLKLFGRNSFSLESPVINALASSYVLSFSKLLSISLLLLSPSLLYDSEGHCAKVVFLLDGSTRYFTGGKQIVFSVFAIFTVCVILVIPTLILLLYPIKPFHTLLRYMKLNRYCLVTLMDMFQGCYKDGSNGTRDCRWFSAVYFILRLFSYTVFIVFYDLVWYASTAVIVIQVMLIVAISLILAFKPYKRDLYNKIDVFILLLGILINSLLLLNELFVEAQNSINAVVQATMITILVIPFTIAVLFISYQCLLKSVFLIRLSLKVRQSMKCTGNTDYGSYNSTADVALLSDDCVPSPYSGTGSFNQ